MFAGLVLLALVLAGAPLTSGMLAKHYLKDLALFTSWPLAPALTLATIGTTLLMARFLWRLRLAPADVTLLRLGALAWPWVALVAAALAAGWLMLPPERASLLAPAALAGAAWPVALGIVIAAVAIRFGRGLRFSLPPGDVLVPAEIALHRLAGFARRLPSMGAMPSVAFPGARLPAAVARLETRLRTWMVVGAALLALLGLFIVLLASG
ncbi:MAG: hypothetical protein WD823_01120 [Sulfuricaulis sp.]|uniref:hypothetical protein n=1 Tax=Sulfuricaulis sp. TaxID=2003553 RepID=UPI0034A387D3